MEMQKELSRRGEAMPEQTRQRPRVAPPVDIFENDDEVLLVADMPGVSREQVAIDLDNEQLTISARRSDEAPGAPWSAEYRPGDYYRAFLVPQGIDADKISADLSDGVLRVHLPKSAVLKPRRIEVRAG
jgi:HSP20 family molecular chaperone IbpA